MDNSKILATAIFNNFIKDLRDLQEAAGGDLELVMEAMAERLELKAEVTSIEDMDAYLEERAVKAGLIAPCIQPGCDIEVDRRKRRSGACCKAHMNYVCTHPDCVEKATQNDWPHYTHRWGTKIAEQHKEFATKSDE